MKNSKKVLLAAAALVSIYSTPAFSEPNIEIKNSTSQEEINRLNKNISRNYQDIKSLNDLGVVYLKLAQYSEAIIQFKRALKIDPPYTLGPIFSGNIYTDVKVHEDKIKELMKVIDMNREYARAHNYLGLAYLKQNNYSTAKISLLESIKINPKYAKAHNNLGVLYEELGETSKAIESYKLASSIDPNDSGSLYNLGLVYDSLGEGENSVRYTVFAKKAHETKHGQEGIGRFNDRLDQLWEKYADKSKNISVVSLDSNKVDHTDTPKKISTDHAPKIKSTPLFTPLDQFSVTSNKISSIAYKTQQAMTADLKPSVIDSDATPVSYHNQSVGEWMPEGSTEKLKPQEEEPTTTWPDKNELTAEVSIKESNFTNPKEIPAPLDSSAVYEKQAETTVDVSSKNKRPLVPKNQEKKTWVSDWVFDYPK